MSHVREAKPPAVWTALAQLQDVDSLVYGCGPTQRKAMETPDTLYAHVDVHTDAFDVPSGDTVRVSIYEDTCVDRCTHAPYVYSSDYAMYGTVVHASHDEILISFGGLTFVANWKDDAKQCMVPAGARVYLTLTSS